MLVATLMAVASSQTVVVQTDNGRNSVMVSGDGVGLVGPNFYGQYGNGYYDGYGYWHPERRVVPRHRAVHGSYYGPGGKHYHKAHKKAYRKAQKRYYKDAKKAHKKARKAWRKHHKHHDHDDD